MSELEKESLEAHVDLCSERYSGLHRELKNLGTRMDKFEKTLLELKDMMVSMKHDRNKQLINWGIGLIGVLASAVGALLFVLLTR